MNPLALHFSLKQNTIMGVKRGPDSPHDPEGGRQKLYSRWGTKHLAWSDQQYQPIKFSRVFFPFLTLFFSSLEALVTAQQEGK